MKNLAIVCLCAAAMFAADRKQLPGQAGNDDLDLSASVIIGHEEVTEAIGADIGDGYIVVRMKAIPKTEQPMRISPDDFTLLSRKDGQKSEALAPSQIAGKGAMIVKSGPADGHKTSWGGFGMGGGLGSSPGTIGKPEIKDTKIDDDAKASPALSALKAKVLPDKETKEPLEGLLYFPIEGKVKPKDLALIYKGPAGKLIMDFAPLKPGK